MPRRREPGFAVAACDTTELGHIFAPIESVLQTKACPTSLPDRAKSIAMLRAIRLHERQ
jgi:hypothetical protein